MSNINTNGRTTVTMEVRGTEGLEGTINNMVDFMKHVIDWGFENNATYFQSALTIDNLLNEVDFSELSLEDTTTLVDFVRVVGLDDYSCYTISEYAYMYTKVLESISED